MKKNMLLIHGWDYELYSKMTNYTDAWDEYTELVSNLEKKYNLYKINFPGFCKQEEPKEKEWDVEKFAKYIEDFIEKNKIKVDIVLGYSFGGPVALKWKDITKSAAKLFLVAPAIIRNADNSKKFTKTPKLLDGIRKTLRNLYVIHIVKNSEMKYGTSFLRNSYQLIVREDMRKELLNINCKDVCIVYGTKDTAVAPKETFDSLPDEYKKSIHMIDDADHDNIIFDYVPQLMKILDKFDQL